MKVRKRTRNGKSLNMKVNKKLHVAAKSKDDVTLAYGLEAYETHFSITLNKIEAKELMNQLRNSVENMGDKDFSQSLGC